MRRFQNQSLQHTCLDVVEIFHEHHSRLGIVFQSKPERLNMVLLSQIFVSLLTDRGLREHALWMARNCASQSTKT